MKVVSFIPIKLNNQRLPGKNTMMLNGRPMCDYLFETISEVDTIDEKYIYCSDEAIKRMSYSLLSVKKITIDR